MNSSCWKGLVGLCCIAFACQTKGEPLSLDSRYFQKSDQQYDIRGFPQFGVEVTNLRHYLLREFTDRYASAEKDSRRILGFIGIEIIAGTIMDQGFLLAHHELSHGARFAAQGWGYRLNTGETEFFSYYFHNFGQSGGYVESTSRNFLPHNPTKYYDSGSSQYTPYADVIISAAGINAEMSYAGFIGDMVDRGEGNISHLQAYWLGKLSTVGYAEDGTGDIQTIRDKLSALGAANLSKAEMDRANYISLIGSYTTWRFLGGVANYFTIGETRISRSPHAVRIPDLENFVTSKGLSYRLTSGYRFNDDFNSTLRVEQVVQGISVTEVTLGADYIFRNLSDLKLEGHFIMGMSPGWGGRISGKLASRLQAYLGVNLDQQNSLEGERNIVSLKDGISTVSSYGGLNYIF